MDAEGNPTTIKEVVAKVKELESEIARLRDGISDDASTPPEGYVAPKSRLDILWDVVKSKMPSDFPRDETPVT